MATRTRRILKIGLVVGAGAFTLSSLHKNRWEVSTIGLLRFGRAAVTVSRIVFDYKVSSMGVDETSKEYKKLRSQIHFRSAEKLLDLCQRNGGLFIKVGQHIGAMSYLLPYEYVSTLKILHSKAPKAALVDVYEVIKEDFGADATEIFQDFDKEPLGAASLAQVHKATLHDGTKVAVKVQHLRVKSHAAIDMATMELLVNIVDRLCPDFTFMWLAEETKRNLPLELDFINEGHNAERVRRIFSSFPWLKVPKIYWNLSTSRILTMEYFEGGQVDDNKYIQHHNLSASEISRKLGQLYSEMIFIQGYVHCDPHPGNILISKNDKSNNVDIVLLDHGLYLTMEEQFRMDYCKMWIALLNADVKNVEYYGRKLGVGDMYYLLACMLTARSWKSIQKGIEKHKSTPEEKKEIRSGAAAHFPEITNILGSVPREMLLIFKTNDLLRGIETSLGIKGAAGSFIAMSKCCIRALYRQKRTHCHTFLGLFQIYVTESFQMSKLYAYEWWLWFKINIFRSTAMQL